MGAFYSGNKLVDDWGNSGRIGNGQYKELCWLKDHDIRFETMTYPCLAQLRLFGHVVDSQQKKEIMQKTQELYNGISDWREWEKKHVCNKFLFTQILLLDAGHDWREQWLSELPKITFDRQVRSRAKQ